ncbi:MAG TPA: NADPH-dependent F420 reductase [Balneolales bacterium]|nr:NADPH-dependent F420 reductase [Balneolales bacterium]
MHIGIIGTGNMGSALGKRFSDAGHQIFYGSIEPGTAKSIADMMGSNVQGGSIANAADFGEALILAIPWVGVQNSIEEAGDLQGRVLIDCSNPFKPDSYDLVFGNDRSGAEFIAQKAKDAQVVKAFNTIFAQNIMRSDEFGDNQPSLFYCGDEDSAKDIIIELGEAINLDPIDCGDLSQARKLENMASLLFNLSDKREEGYKLAYSLLTRPE